MSRVRSNRVAFTLNNYKVEDTDLILKRIEVLKENVVYAIIAEEIGEKGTPHLQGFIHTKDDPKNCGIKYWKSLLGVGQGIHLENAKGSDEQNRLYCKKDGPYAEFGAPSQENDCTWGRIIEQCKLGDLEGALDISPEHSIKYVHQIKTLVNQYKRPVFREEIELKDWQKKCMEMLRSQNSRSILFVVDEEGGKGKSVLAKHLLSTTSSWGCQGTLILKGFIHESFFFMPAGSAYAYLLQRSPR